MEVFNITYMDDATWIGNNKKNLEKYTSKSKLLVLNNKEPLDNKFIKYGKHKSIIYPEKMELQLDFWMSG